MDTKILLENGTNELEVLEFVLDGYAYGINVAKVKEITPYQETVPVPHANPCIEGIFMPRERLITAIDLRNCLGRGVSKPGGLYIITNFNKLAIAFHVDAVRRIHRVSWENIIKPGAELFNEEESITTGIVKLEGRLVIILDFGKIVTDINPETGLRISEIDELGARGRSDVPILIAEDSVLLNRLIVNCLKKAGYNNLTRTYNGLEAYEYIMECKNQGTLGEDVKCIVTDIEMPMMDGHRLIKLVKDDPVTKEIPIVIFSSLVNEEMKRKGEALGASAQLSKPEIGNLVKGIDGLVGNV